MTICSRSCMYRCAMRSTSFGMVALKRRVRRMSGVLARMVSMSSWNPMSNISSASSITRWRIASKWIFPRFIRSIRRPGVATMIWGVMSNARNWMMMFSPPYTATMFRPFRCFPKFFRSLAICTQSSRVGASMRDCVWRRLVSVFCRRGRPKAAVFPVPVCAMAMRSFDSFNTKGMAFSCIGIASSKPNSSMLCRSSSFKPSSLNLIFSLYYQDVSASELSVSLFFLK